MDKKRQAVPIDLLTEARYTVKKLLDRVSLVALTLGTVAVAASLFRITRLGMHPSVVVDMFFFPAIVLVVLIRKRLKETTALGMLVGLTTAKAVFNFITLGLASVSFAILATCAIITLTVFGQRRGYMYLAGSILAVVMVGLTRGYGLLPPIPLEAGYLEAPNIWVMQISTYMVFTIIMLVTVANIQNRLAEVLNRQARQGRELEEREERYRLLAENMRDAVFVQDMNFNILYASPSVEKVFGYTAEEMKSKKMSDVMTPASLEWAMTTFGKYVNQAVTTGNTDVPELEFEYIRKDGSLFPGIIRPTFLFDDRGTLTGTQTVLVDITERKKAETELRRALEEKDVLLRELYHRTKNNMQVIYSMLSLQKGYTDDPASLALFRDIQGRIQAMSLVHQKLYRSHNLTDINLAEYVQELYDLLLAGYRHLSGQVTLCLDIELLPVTIDTAVPCGLILNELITNSLKYAFPDGRAGRIMVHVRRTEDGRVVLEYRDNGAGVPEKFDFRGTGTLGMQVIHGIAEHQLQGSVVWSGTEGVACTIAFDDTIYKERI